MPSDDEDQDINWDNLKTITTLDGCELFTFENKKISRTFCDSNVPTI